MCSESVPLSSCPGREGVPDASTRRIPRAKGAKSQLIVDRSKGRESRRCTSTLLFCKATREFPGRNREWYGRRAASKEGAATESGLFDRLQFSLASGLWNWAVAKQELNVLVVGLAGSGKTCIMEQQKRRFVKGYRGDWRKGRIPTSLVHSAFSRVGQVRASTQFRRPWA